MISSPKLWTQILTKIKPFFPKACVAGGCIRDFMLATPPKDIDVFVDFSDEISMELMIPELKALGFEMEVFDVPLDDETPGYSANMVEDEHAVGIVGILDGRYGDIPVQIIARSYTDFSPENVISDFDFNLCKGYFTVATGMVITEAMQKDLDYKKASIIKRFSEDRLNRSRERFDRFNARHDNRWTFEFTTPKREWVNSDTYHRLNGEGMKFKLVDTRPLMPNEPWIQIEYD